MSIHPDHQAHAQYQGRASYEFVSRGNFQCDGFRVTVAGHTIAECEDSEVADWICRQWNVHHLEAFTLREQSKILNEE